MDVNKNSNLYERIQALLADALQVPVDLVTPDLAFGDLPQWDSLGHMEVMIHLEEQFGLEINGDSIAELTNVPFICEILQKGGFDA